MRGRALATTVGVGSVALALVLTAGSQRGIVSFLEASLCLSRWAWPGERNHQGLANVLLTGTPTPANTNASGQRRERLGGLLNYYHRGAA